MIKNVLISGLLLSKLASFFKPDPNPIFGVYQQPGKFYQIKYLLFLCLITFRKVYFNIFYWYFVNKIFGFSGGLVAEALVVVRVLKIFPMLLKLKNHRNYPIIHWVSMQHFLLVQIQKVID